MYKLKRISNKKDWETFTEIVETTDGTSFTLHPDWLQGYEILPFFIKKIGYFVLDDKGIIMAGISGIKFWRGKWLTAFPSDPVFMKEISEETKLIIWKLIINLCDNQLHISSTLELEKIGLVKSKFPRGIYPNPGIGSIEIFSSSDVQIMSLKYQVRRNIKRAMEQGIEIIEINNPKELKLFYSICKVNARENNYSIRPFFIISKIWRKGLKSGSCCFFMAKSKDDFVGAIWVMKSGNMFHNIMGGSLKLKPRLEVGYAMQWGMLELSRIKQFNQYNISIGGPKGVEQFKDDFGREKINLTQQYARIF